ncbi:unnamed protein product (macronuclear) [Paramecium tetraurelia]|uniref:Cyclic nucleotide-binding domain-containing protein n=1 Tax=Paramecium tetraurelia TaxID=5888 RepID=A0E3Y2_PARTE|nr:uncharacterized protein GSPATT00023172001 [Paramecium tetraurelia]CAK89999.1 unnamed protein product [Paramecium tetraurelia]|eukprot:XP_001457396.1 hypothetical protein (macronuclear) [Paramecium tetraurelia strain d4-2]
MSSDDLGGQDENYESIQRDSLWRDEHQMEESAQLIHFLVLGLICGLILREFNKKTNIPYSPMILALGLAVGLSQEYLGKIGNSAHILSKMHPHLIVFIFIPVLLFESAFNCDWYTFKYQIINILLLAGPGCGWGAILLGACFKLVLQYGDEDMNWYEAFTLGSVLSATDPVAVVALLKELGANPAFNHLIEGEALLNDGVAMVLFNVFNNISKASSGKGEAVNGGDIILTFLRTSFLGPIMGLILGLLVALWTRRILGDDVEVTWLTFVFTYFTFYWAEFEFFKTSGLLAVVGLGLFWCAHAKTRIRASVEHSVHAVWGFVQYSCDTLVFLLVGIIVGIEIMEEKLILTSDYYKMVGFYFLMILARLLMVLTFYPFLKCFGYPISKSELIVLVYGGLRGGLGLTLSLMVGCDEDLPARFRHLAVFYAAAMALITNMINGTTCKTLVKCVKMIDEPIVKKKVYKKYLEELIVIQQDLVKELETDEFYNMTDWATVNNLIGQQDFIEKIDKVEQEIKHLIQKRGFQEMIYEGLPNQEVFGEVRYRFYRILKGLYYHKYEEGLCEEQTVRMLVESSDVGLDKLSDNLEIWDELYKNFMNLCSVNFFFKVKQKFLIGYFAREYLIRHLGLVYDVTSSFIICAEEALKLADNFPMNKEAISIIQEELKKEIEKAQSYFGTLNGSFPEIVRVLQTKKASFSILTHSIEHVQSTQRRGLIDDKEYKILMKDINIKLVKLESHSYDMSLPSFHVIAMQFPIFQEISLSDLDIIKKVAVERKYALGQVIYSKGSECNEVYIIMRGYVVNEYNGILITKGLGSLITHQSLIVDGNHMSTAKAAVESLLYALPTKVIKEVMIRNKDFEFKVYLHSIEYIRKWYENQVGPLAQMELKRLNELLRNKSRLVKLTTLSQIEFINGGFLFSGELRDPKNNVFNKYDYIAPTEGLFTAAANSTCFVFDEQIEVLQSKRMKELKLDSQRDQEIHEKYSEIKRNSVLELSKINIT